MCALWYLVSFTVIAGGLIHLSVAIHFLLLCSILLGDNHSLSFLLVMSLG